MYCLVNEYKVYDTKGKKLVSVNDLPDGETIKVPDWCPLDTIIGRNRFNEVRTRYTTLNKLRVESTNKGLRILVGKTSMYVDCSVSLSAWMYKFTMGDEVISGLMNINGFAYTEHPYDTMPKGRAGFNTCSGCTSEMAEVYIRGRKLAGRCYLLCRGTTVILLKDDFSFDAVGIARRYGDTFVDMERIFHTVNPYIVKFQLLVMSGEEDYKAEYEDSY